MSGVAAVIAAITMNIFALLRGALWKKRA